MIDILLTVYFFVAIGGAAFACLYVYASAISKPDKEDC